MTDASALCDNPMLINFLIDKHGMMHSPAFNLIRTLVVAHNTVIGAVDKERSVYSVGTYSVFLCVKDLM